MGRIIIGRHPAAIEWLRREHPSLADVPVLSSATPDDVRGKHIFGVVPLFLAAEAASVSVIEFATPPRGQEYTIADMDAAGARLATYRVVQN